MSDPNSLPSDSEDNPIVAVHVTFDENPEAHVRYIRLRDCPPYEPQPDALQECPGASAMNVIVEEVVEGGGRRWIRIPLPEVNASGDGPVPQTE